MTKGFSTFDSPRFRGRFIWLMLSCVVLGMVILLSARWV